MNDPVPGGRPGHDGGRLGVVAAPEAGLGDLAHETGVVGGQPGGHGVGGGVAGGLGSGEGGEDLLGELDGVALAGGDLDAGLVPDLVVDEGVELDGGKVCGWNGRVRVTVIAKW